MEIDLKPGVYVLAVSGGVDSMVLLDLMVKKQQAWRTRPLTEFANPPYIFTVAHYDHGIRGDSKKDRTLVQDTAKKQGLPFVYDEGNLGPDASEAAARKARYKFLSKVKKMSGADAIITAHHQDDLIETAIINLLRGTGRKGLSSLADEESLRRPLLNWSKAELRAHAKKHKLKWHEDPTNIDTKHQRNYIRAKIVPKLTKKQRQEFLKLLAGSRTANKTIDEQITGLLRLLGSGKSLDRKLFINLPHKVALETMAGWLRSNGIRQFDKKLLEKLVTNVKTLSSGKQTDVDKGHILKVTKQYIRLAKRPAK